MVARLSEVLQPQHVNQVFTGVGASRTFRQDETVINGLVSPTGKVGYVNIATGPLSSVRQRRSTYRNRHQIVERHGGSSIKYFPMKGLAHKEEYQAVAAACAKYDFYLEPTGALI